MKILFHLLTLLGLLTQLLTAFPTKDELLDRLYLVTVGTKGRYGQFLSDGILTDRHLPFTHKAPAHLEEDEREDCPNLAPCDPSVKKDYFLLTGQKGIFHFSPGRVFEVSSETTINASTLEQTPGERVYPLPTSGSIPENLLWNDFDVAYILPLRHVYKKTINVGWTEFITYDDIPLQKGDMVILDESIPVTDYLKNNGIQVLSFDFKGMPLEERAEKKKTLVWEAIKEKGGFLIQSSGSDGELDGQKDLTIDGQGLDRKDKKAFFQSILNEYILYGYGTLQKHPRFGWIENIPLCQAGYDRNFGLEFYFFMQSILDFVKERGVPLEDVGSFKEFLIANMQAWDLMSIYKASTVTPEALESTMREKVAQYKDQPLETLFDDLIEKGVHSYTDIPSSKMLFKKNFSDFTRGMSRDQLHKLIAGYKAFLLKAGITSPYPLNNLEEELINIYDQLSSPMQRLMEKMIQDPELLNNLALDSEDPTRANPESLMLELLDQWSVYYPDNPSSTQQLREDILTEACQPNEHSDASQPWFDRCKTYFLGLANDVYRPVYINQKELIVDNVHFGINLDIQLEHPFSPAAKDKEVLLGNSRPGAELIVTANNQTVTTFSLQNTLTQTANIEVQGIPFSIKVQIKEDTKEPAYRVNVEIEPQDVVPVNCEKEL